MKYTVARSMLEGQPIAVLEDDGGRRVRVAFHGAALIGFEVARGGRPFDIAAGYHDAAAIITRPGSRFGVMVPFAGRIADARYRFDGGDYDLQPGAAAAKRESRHGFVRDTDFAVTELAADARSARVTLSTSTGRVPGYPFAIDVSVSFALEASGLALSVRMRNTSDEPAPCFFGWHPYFRVSDGRVDEWELEIPAQTLIRTGDDLIALSGDAAYVPLDNAREVDFRRQRAIEGSVLDHEYTDLVAGTDGRFRTRLTDPRSGFGITVWQERGVMHAFTGDTLKVDARRSIALEPMECMANAFNRPEWAEALRLDPGVERVFRCGVEPDA
jgi:aldose 1-epimerase